MGRCPDAVAEAMEGAGVLAAARIHGVAFAEVRTISNLVGPARSRVLADRTSSRRAGHGHCRRDPHCAVRAVVSSMSEHRKERSSA